MPKGVYPHTHIKPRIYPPEIVTLAVDAYCAGATVAEVQAALPKGYKAQRILERHLPRRRTAAKRDQRGERNGTWRGEDVSYGGAHVRVAALRGPARDHRCVDCDAMAADWSYNHTDPTPRTEGGLVFSPDVAHYSPRCRPCHRALDRAHREEVTPNVR